MQINVSLKELIGRFNAVTPMMLVGVQAVIEQTSERIRQTAAQKFGTYQPQVGQFEAWPALAADTLIKKYAAGAPDDDPLVGYYANNGGNKIWGQKLKDSLEVDIQPLLGIIYSDDPIALWQEYGVPEHNLPPRPFLMPAGYQEEDRFRKEIIAVVAATFRG